MWRRTQIGVSKMTITEEIDKKSQRPHRSKNITDALKYAYGLTGEESPVNIADAVKKGMTPANVEPEPEPTPDPEPEPTPDPEPAE